MNELYEKHGGAGSADDLPMSGSPGEVLDQSFGDKVIPADLLHTVAVDVGPHQHPNVSSFSP